MKPSTRSKLRGIIPPIEDTLRECEAAGVVVDWTLVATLRQELEREPVIE